MTFLHELTILSLIVYIGTIILIIFIVVEGISPINDFVATTSEHMLISNN